MTPIDSYAEDSLKSQENKIFNGKINIIVDFSYENQKYNPTDPKNDVDMK